MALYSALKKWRWRKRSCRTPLNALYHATPVARSRRVRDVRFLVLDCEMSGLDPRKSELLSVGWVRIQNSHIQYSTRKHLLMHMRDGVGESIKIHGLFDYNLAGAGSVASVLGALAKEIPGSILVFHHALLDIAFLQKASLQSFGCPLHFQYIDTMAVEQQRLNRQGKAANLRLNMCRDRYGLPKAFEHNAMFDAVATAELLLAQIAYAGNIDNIRIGQFQPRWA